MVRPTSSASRCPITSTPWKVFKAELVALPAVDIPKSNVTIQQFGSSHGL